MAQRGYPIVVVGAGAAGLMAARFAADAGADVMLLETTKEGGRKILISGGGRCNILPAALDPTRFVTSSSRHAMRRILLSWPLEGQRRFFEQDLGLPLALEPETGKFFPVSNRAREVRDALLAACLKQRVQCRFSAKVVGLDPPSGASPWQARLATGECLPAAAVILATGGLSVPATGSDGTGLSIAAALGHRVNPTYPALTPLIAEPPRHAALAGISLRVRLEVAGAGERIATVGGFLFTHRGYSGPAVLDLSHRAVLSRLQGGPRAEFQVNWCDREEAAWEGLLGQDRARVETPLRRHLPERLALMLLAEAQVERGVTLSQLRRAERKRLLQLLVRYPLPWTSDEGFAKAEVTGGGVALEEIDLGSLESRRHPGLFFCGEMLDCFGPIGGHNFAWAWASGRAAGRGANAKVSARMTNP